MGRNASAVATEGVKEGEGTIFVVEWVAPERVVGVDIT
jgi:hypothetical protein